MKLRGFLKSFRSWAISSLCCRGVLSEHFTEKGAYDEAIKKISDCRWIDERTRSFL